MERSEILHQLINEAWEQICTYYQTDGKAPIKQWDGCPSTTIWTEHDFVFQFARILAEKNIEGQSLGNWLHFECPAGRYRLDMAIADPKIYKDALQSGNSFPKNALLIGANFSIVLTNKTLKGEYAFNKVEKDAAKLTELVKTNKIEKGIVFVVDKIGINEKKIDDLKSQYKAKNVFIYWAY